MIWIQGKAYCRNKYSDGNNPPLLIFGVSDAKALRIQDKSLKKKAVTLPTTSSSFQYCSGKKCFRRSHTESPRTTCNLLYLRYGNFFVGGTIEFHSSQKMIRRILKFKPIPTASGSNQVIVSAALFIKQLSLVRTRLRRQSTIDNGTIILGLFLHWLSNPWAVSWKMPQCSHPVEGI